MVENIKNAARQVLIINTAAGNESFFWERAQRLADNCKNICKLLDLNNPSIKIDSFCLEAAAYFNDVGIAKRLSEQQEPPGTYNLYNNRTEIPELCAEVAAEMLTDLLESGQIAKIGTILVESSNNASKMPEAMILFDACGLDDIGLVGLFNELRKSVTAGKGIYDVINSWEKKVTYGYWQARLKDGFRFDESRKIAESRLSVANEFIDRLKKESIGHDLKGLIVNKLNHNKEQQS